MYSYYSFVINDFIGKIEINARFTFFVNKQSNLAITIYN